MGSRSVYSLRDGVADRVVILWLCAVSLACVAAIVLTLSRTSSHYQSPDANLEASGHEPPSQRSPLAQAATISLGAVAPKCSSEQLIGEGRAVVQQLIERFDDMPEALNIAAVFHAQVRESEQAIELWKKCIQLDAKSPQYRVNLAAIAMDRGDATLAIQTLRTLVDTGDTSPSVLCSYGLALMEGGDSDEAERIFKLVTKSHPNDPSFWLGLGQAELKNHHFEQAFESLRKAEQLGSKAQALYFSLSRVCRRLGKDELADSYEGRFSDLDQESTTDSQNRFEKLSVAQSQRTLFSLLMDAGAFYAYRDDLMMAETLFLRILTLDPSNLTACNRLVEIYQKEKSHANELVIRQRIAALQPLNFGSHLGVARAASAMGDRSLAEASLKLALSLDLNAAIGYVALAEFQYESGDFQAARWYAEQAIRVSPTPEAYNFLAKVCEQLGDRQAAAQAKQDALKSKSPVKP